MDVSALVKDAELEVNEEIETKKKESLKVVLKEINEAKEIVRRLESKKDRLITELSI